MGEKYLDYVLSDLEYSNLYLLFLKIIDDIERGVFKDIYPKVNDLNKMKRRTLEDNKEISNTLDLFVKDIYENQWEERKIIGIDSKIQAHEVHVISNTSKGKYVFIFLAIYDYRILCNYFPYDEYKNIKGDYLIPKIDWINTDVFSGKYKDRPIVNSYKAFLSFCEENGHNPHRGVNKAFHGNFTKSLNYLEDLDSILVNKEMFDILDYVIEGKFSFILYNDIIFLTHYKGEEIEDDPLEDDEGSGCVFCGDTTYGDIVCPSCANNID